MHYQRVKRTGSPHTSSEQPRRGRGPHLPLPSTLPREQWLVWAAGFVDGEGCIFIQYRRPTRTHYLKLTVPQLNPAPLYILQSLFGGALRPKAGRTAPYRRLWIWEVSSRQAADAIQEMRPYLVVKGAEAAVAFEFQAGLGRAIQNGVPPEERARRQELADQLKELKARTYPAHED